MTTYDPSAYTVDQVNAYLAEHPDEARDVLMAEADGKARAGITAGPTAQRLADEDAAEAEAGAAHEPTDEPAEGTLSTRGLTLAEVDQGTDDDTQGYVGPTPDPNAEVPLGQRALEVTDESHADALGQNDQGFIGTSPERERTGLDDKGLSLASVIARQAEADEPTPEG